ncbi:8743_t:CDS:1, partial [Funneliformis geosporum]
GENVAESDPVGGVKMPKIEKVDGGFEVNGNKFINIEAAQGRQCDIQHNLCFNKFNGGDRSFSGADCDNQTNVCKSGSPVFA